MTFREGERGQSIQVGAVLIFGLVVVLFSSYQAFVVPSQNQQIEFNHHQDVERDMVDLRAAILQSKTTGQDQYTTVQLGTEFPSRIIARNPPDPGGTLRTTDNRTLRVDIPGENEKMDDWFTEYVDENRFIDYSPAYSEYFEGGPVRYENTVVYKEFDNSNVVVTEQRLLQNDTISLVPVHRQYQASGRQNAPIEPVPSAIQTEEGVENPNITLGTDLDNETWVDIFSEEIEAGVLNASDINVTTLNGEQVLQLNLTGTFDIEYSPVGLDRPPFAIQPGDDALEINPAAPGDVRFVEVVSRNKDGSIFRFNNTAATTNWTEARISFYKSQSKEVVYGNISDVDKGAVSGNLSTGGNYVELDPLITIQEGESTVELVFYRKDGGNFKKYKPNKDDWFVLTVIFETGERGTYFISFSD